MKRELRFWLLVVSAVVCLLSAVLRIHLQSVYAQEGSSPYYGGSFLISSYIDVDSNYNLYARSTMQVGFDENENVDAIRVYGYLDQDGGDVAQDFGDGDDYSPAYVIFTSNYPVDTGSEYGLESDGFACFDNGEGDCEPEYIGTAYASVYVAVPLPQISSVSPSSVNQGDKGSLVVTGTNLVVGVSDRLTADLTGTASSSAGPSPFTLSGIPTANTASFSYDFTGYPEGSYAFAVTNNEGNSNGEDFSVHPAPPPPLPPPAWPLDPCGASSSSPQVHFTSLTSSGTSGGTGAVTVSFTGSAYSAVSQTISYGPYSTPSSVAANIAALITANYTRSGLTARAFGPNIVYTGKSAVGAVNHAITGTSITTTTSSMAEAAAKMACASAPPTPSPICADVNPKYVLAVTNDSVVWKDDGLNHGRFVTYSLENLPISNGLGIPTSFQSTIIEHLSNVMSFGLTTKSPLSGEFDDVLGNIGGYNSGTYTSDRCFTVTSTTMGNLGHVLTYDQAGKHAFDHIVITLPRGPSILNKWTNPDGSPKDISIP